MKTLGVLAALLLVLAGCAGPTWTGHVPTAEEGCRFGSGVYRHGLCDYCI